MNAPVSHLLLQPVTQRDPCGTAATSKPAQLERDRSAGAGEVARSHYSPEFKPQPGTSWFLLAAHEPYLDGAVNVVCTRLALSFDSKAMWATMPERAEWRRADTWRRLEWLKSWMQAEISAAQDQAIRLVDAGPISTIGD